MPDIVRIRIQKKILPLPSLSPHECDREYGVADRKIKTRHYSASLLVWEKQMRERKKSHFIIARL